MGRCKKTRKKEYPVDKIINKKDTPHGVEYKLVWKGDHEDTWEPIRNLKNAWSAKADYEEGRRGGNGGGGSFCIGGARWMTELAPAEMAASVADMWRRRCRGLLELDDLLDTVNRHPVDNTSDYVQREAARYASRILTDLRRVLRRDMLAAMGPVRRVVDVRLFEVEQMLLWAADGGVEHRIRTNVMDESPDEVEGNTGRGVCPQEGQEGNGRHGRG